MNSSIIKAALAYILSSFSVQGVAFITQLLLMRWFTVAEYGKYALAFEALAVCNLIINGAFRNFYLKEIRNGKSFNILLPYQLIYGTFWCSLSGVIISILFKMDISVCISICASMVLSSLFLPISMEFLAKGYKWRLIFRDVLNATATLLVSFSLIKLSFSDAKPYIWAILISQVVVNFIAFFKLNLLKDFFCFENIKKIEISIIPFFGVFIVNTIYNKIGISYVNYFLGIESVALYLAVFKFITPFYSIQAALISAVMPKFTSEQRFRFDLKFFSFFAFPGALASLFLILFFPYIISLFSLVKFTGLYYLMIYSAPVIFVVFIYGALSNYIAVNGGQKYIIMTNAVGASFYIILLLICHVLFKSADMLVYTITLFVITECVVCILYYYKIKKENFISYSFLISPLIIIGYELITLLFK